MSTFAPWIAALWTALFLWRRRDEDKWAEVDVEDMEDTVMADMAGM